VSHRHAAPASLAQDVAVAFEDHPDVDVIDGAGQREPLLDRIRGGDARVTIVVAGADLAPLDRATLLAGIPVLAIELGPDRRIGALDLASTAGERATIDAARFLAGAESTTGQVLTVSG
jgi:hypothetical protein